MKNSSLSLPQTYNQSTDTASIASLNWKVYFNDPNLSALIESALQNNQELHIATQEIQQSQNEVRARKGEYLPSVGLRAGATIDKIGQYTRLGALEEQLEIAPEKKFPKPFSDLMLGAAASWELDVWKKLRNAKKSALMRYFATVEGRNFLITNLVAEIANSYYELLALDKLIEIISQNVEIQNNALQIIAQEKESAKATQLAVNRFEAQLLNTKNLQYQVKQRITETENHLNFLVGRFPQPVLRNAQTFFDSTSLSTQTGIPSQLLAKRPDIRRAEFELQASKLDVSVARANFYPSFNLTGQAGLQAFNTTYLFNPHSALYTLASDMVAPLINRNAIKAIYFNANSRQMQALHQYEQTLLNAYVDALNQLAATDNFLKSYYTKKREIEILYQSVDIASDLYRYARADYMEVLLTQKEALNEKFNLVEIRGKVFTAKVGLYRALGGGWN